MHKLYYLCITFRLNLTLSMVNNIWCYTTPKLAELTVSKLPPHKLTNSYFVIVIDVFVVAEVFN